MLSSNSSNRTVSNPTRTACFADDSEGVKIARILAYCIIILISVVGNSGIIAVVLREKRMRHSINYFIASMSFCDVLMTVGYMPRMLTIIVFGYGWLVDGLAGLLFCKTVSFLYDTCVCVSIFTAIAISLDRFLAVTFPLRTYVPKRTSKIIIAAIWLSGVIIQYPLLHAAATVTVNGQTRCHSNLDQTFGVGSGKLYYNIISTIYASSLCTTVVLYSLILISLKLKRDDILGTQNSQGQRQRQKSCRNVIRMVLVVIGFFVFSWSLFVLQLVLYSHEIVLFKSCNVNFIVTLLAHSNCAVTPCLYIVFSENYRLGFQRCFRPVLLACCVQAEAQNRRVAARTTQTTNVQPPVEFTTRARGTLLNEDTLETDRIVDLDTHIEGKRHSARPLFLSTRTGTFPGSWIRRLSVRESLL